MPIQYISGDLFANRFNAHALAHGCNCKGSMGAGIAVGFKNRYPAMYEEYRRRCKATPREFNLGDVFLWKEEGKPWVFNLATQEDYWRSRATYENVEKCLSRLKSIADQEGVPTIAIPRIGAGYGGLSWKKVKVIIERVFHNGSGMLYVYDEYIAETQ
jgi:O-acetyl-ADP-ribose deacetylase (regulator of RNase III)